MSVTVGRGLYGVLERSILIRVVAVLRGFVANDSGPGCCFRLQVCKERNLCTSCGLCKKLVRTRDSLEFGNRFTVRNYLKTISSSLLFGLQWVAVPVCKLNVLSLEIRI